jgi:hypothetical protein
MEPLRRPGRLGVSEADGENLYWNTGGSQRCELLKHPDTLRI